MVVEFEDEIAHVVEEIAVVCHHEQCLVAAREESLQPFYHLQIEVVGGLVEYEQVGFEDEHVSQCHPFLLSSAELAHGLFEVGYLEGGQYLLGLQHSLRVALMVEARIEHGVFRIELRTLLKACHPQVVAVDNGARFVAFLSCQDGQKGRFSGSVLCDEPHALAFGYGERYIFE